MGASSEHMCLSSDHLLNDNDSFIFAHKTKENTRMEIYLHVSSITSKWQK